MTYVRLYRSKDLQDKLKNRLPKKYCGITVLSIPNDPSIRLHLNHNQIAIIPRFPVNHEHQITMVYIDKLNRRICI
jgi:hypothetical protein